MLAADGVLEAIGGAQRRERIANRRRLVALYSVSGRANRADAYR
jgi:hypothetical protein